jgi:hypothetical protein
LIFKKIYRNHPGLIFIFTKKGFLNSQTLKIRVKKYANNMLWSKPSSSDKSRAKAHRDGRHFYCKNFNMKENLNLKET